MRRVLIGEGRVRVNGPDRGKALSGRSRDIASVIPALSRDRWPVHDWWADRLRRPDPGAQAGMTHQHWTNPGNGR
jgi:hypothetical protein